MSRYRKYWIMLGLVIALAGCGKKGPPVPPQDPARAFSQYHRSLFAQTDAAQVQPNIIGQHLDPRLYRIP